MPRRSVHIDRSPILTGLGYLTAGVLALAGLGFLTGHAAPHAAGPLRHVVGAVFLLLATYRAVVTATPRAR